MNNKAAWVKIVLTVLAFAISIGILWGTLTTRSEANTRRIDVLESRGKEYGDMFTQILVRLAQIEERVISIDRKLD